jgi:hypothetical protein
MILDITKIQKEISIWENGMFVRGLTTLDESIQHINLAMEATNAMRDSFAQDIDLRNQCLGIIQTSNEYLILNRLRLFLCITGEGLETIDDIIAADVSISRHEPGATYMSA